MGGSATIDSETMISTKLCVKVYPFRKNGGMGNIIWAARNLGNAHYRVSKYAMRAGKWPANHPVGGTQHATDASQGGSGASIDAFRSRGYWASCFPEGDGITWKPLNGQPDDQCMTDIRECFGWDAKWGPLVYTKKSPD
jgi:hypothetical protein